MPYTPSSRILILTICSLNKAMGGTIEYDTGEALASRLTAAVVDPLMRNRERIRHLITGGEEIVWCGVAVSRLEFNRQLLQGPDFGGRDRRAAYLPALERYDGRFYQALGDDGRLKLLGSSHHFLILSGLYGLLTPTEPIQLYSCPLVAQAANIWKSDSVLTKVLTAYVKEHGILRIIDLTALAAYRNLVDWPSVMDDTGANVLHCFDSMAPGDQALVPFGKLVKNYLLDASEEDLLGICSGETMFGVVFHSIDKAPTGLPEELVDIELSKREIPLLEGHPVKYIREVVSGGQPIKGEDFAPSDDWLIALTSPFRKQLNGLDKNIQGRVMAAITEICRDPTARRGDTVKPLVRELTGLWRYRLGDYRLVYNPVESRRTVFLVAVGARGGVYDQN